MSTGAGAGVAATGAGFADRQQIATAATKATKHTRETAAPV